MRGLCLVLCSVVVGCSSEEPLLGMPNGNPGAQDQWADDAGSPLHTARFGGSIDMGDDGEVEVDGTIEGGGEEYVVVTAQDGTVECDWRWTTDAYDSPTGDCVGCDVAWDVTCYDGRQAAGNCEGWFDPDVSGGPVQFYLAFEPTEVVGGVEQGPIYVRGSLYDPWSVYALGSREGTVVRYAYEYDLY